MADVRNTGKMIVMCAIWLGRYQNPLPQYLPLGNLLPVSQDFKQSSGGVMPDFTES